MERGGCGERVSRKMSGQRAGRGQKRDTHRQRIKSYSVKRLPSHHKALSSIPEKKIIIIKRVTQSEGGGRKEEMEADFPQTEPSQLWTVLPGTKHFQKSQLGSSERGEGRLKLLSQTFKQICLDPAAF